jgi:hypothetical protein
MFCVSSVSLTPFFPQCLNFEHRDFAVGGGVCKNVTLANGELTRNKMIKYCLLCQKLFDVVSTTRYLIIQY